MTDADHGSGRAQLVPLIEATELSRFGGKAFELARCMLAGLPVPAGAALSAQHAAGLMCGTLTLSGLEILESIANPCGTWAVRSSGVGEDSSDASFAGQHLTELGVSRDELPRAIGRVVASAESAGATAYRNQMRLASISAVPMGIVIQRMVRAEVSGVLFSRHPVSHANVRFVEASYGLGEAVVAGLVAPDQYVIAPGGELLEQHLGEKDVEHVLSPDGTVQEREVDAPRAGRLCLGDEHFMRLDDLAERALDLLRAPVDLEWALCSGELFLLQMRPITA